MTLDQMREIEEANTPKFRVHFETVNDEGNWVKISQTAMNQREVELKKKYADKNPRTRNFRSESI